MTIPSKLLTFTLVFLGIIGLAFGIFFSGSTAVQANANLSGVQVTPRPTPDFTFLENWLKREQIALANQAERLKLSNQAISTAQQFIDNQKAAGKDTSVLEAALAAFSKAVSDTQALHDTAANILAAHAGYNADGKVTDAKQALVTLHNAGLPMREAHLKITQATLDFRQSLRAYLQANQ